MIELLRLLGFTLAGVFRSRRDLLLAHIVALGCAPPYRRRIPYRLRLLGASLVATCPAA